MRFNGSLKEKREQHPASNAGGCQGGDTQPPPCNSKAANFLSSRTLVLLVSVLWLFFSISLFQSNAQEFRASITGEVADTSGAMIPRASITAVNADTHVKYSTKSDGQGVYSLLYLLPGSYTVTIGATNFKTTVFDHIRLDSGQKLGLNATLKPGSVAEQVIVTPSEVELDTVSASMQAVVDQRQVENIPSSGHEVFDDVIFTQGVRINGLAFNTFPRNNAITYTAAGAQTDENAFYINGAPVSDTGSWYLVPTEQAVQQVQVQSMPYDAQYGRTGGGAFSVNVKDGTNAYHGMVFEYYGNQALNANTWVADLTGAKKPINIRNTYGGESGGPIKKGKIFYFGSYERLVQHQPMAESDTVPTAAWINGNFAGSGYTIYDPTSTYCAKTNSSGGCTTYARKPFPNDQIPASAISKIGQAILALYPSPNRSGFTNNYFVDVPRILGYDEYIGRVDDDFSANTRMYVLFMRQYDFSHGSGNGFSNVAATSSDQISTDYNSVVDLTHIFSPSLVLDAKASYDRNYAINTNGLALKNNYVASNLGFNMPAVATALKQNIVPTLGISGMTNLFGDTQNGSFHADAYFAGSLTQLFGRHSLHYGAEFMDIQTAPTGTLGTPNGAFTFSSNFTQANPLAAATGSGNEIADVLLGYPSSGSIVWSDPTFITIHYYGLFAQDDFKVNSKLALNLGLRWDVNKSPRDRENRINAGFCLTCTNPYSGQVNFGNAPVLQSPLLGGYLFAGVGGASSTPYKVYWNDWQPRVGFSWAVDQNTVLRGGYGIFFPWQPEAVDTQGFSETTSFVASLDGGLTPDNYFNSGTPYPSGAIAPSGAGEGLETSAGQAVSFNDLNRKLRMTQHWSLGIQRTLPGSLLVDMEYLGTNIHAIPVTESLGVISAAQQQACYSGSVACNVNITNPFYGVLPKNTPLGASAKIPSWELMRSYPLFNGVSETRVPIGTSHFNALSVRVERKVASLDFNFNYAYANWMDIDSFLNNGNFRDANLTKTLDPGDVRNYAGGTVVFPVPSTKKTGVLGALTNGWFLDSTITHSTGTPLVLPSANFNWGTPGCTSYAPAGGQTRAHWFNNNESCWTQLSVWESRTTPLRIGFIRNPAFTLWNPAFHKQFKLPREGMFAQFRMEAFNGANHPMWLSPSTAVGTPPSYARNTSWTGFGTIPTGEASANRVILTSLKILF